MPEVDHSFEDCEWEAFLDGLEHHWEAMREELNCGPGLSDAELEAINESLRFDDHMALWGDLDPTASGFDRRRREGA